MDNNGEMNKQNNENLNVNGQNINNQNDGNVRGNNQNLCSFSFLIFILAFNIT